MPDAQEDFQGPVARLIKHADAHHGIARKNNMGAVLENEFTFLQLQNSGAQARRINLQLEHAPEMGDNVLFERRQKAAEGLVHQLKVLRLEEKALLPEKGFEHVHGYSLGKSSMVCADR